MSTYLLQKLAPEERIKFLFDIPVSYNCISVLSNNIKEAALYYALKIMASFIVN